MPTRETEAQGPGVGDAAKSVAEHASAIARLELELAGIELKGKLAALGMGIGLGIGAALFMLFVLGFAFATVAAGLATAMPTWVALLVTTVILLAIAGVLGLLAIGAIKRGTPPVPKQAIEEAKLTSAALKSNGRR